jgi:HD-GYP domain-containing protein (c-di-GMP phosphodiesterase class II)
VHSAGRAAIPEGILSKAPNLNESDLRYLQQHPIVAERLASLDPHLAPCAPIVRASHEWWDGTGYPDRLAGTGIPVEARILHACDSVVSLIAANGDPSRQLDERSGTQFDPSVVQSLHRCLEKREFGLPALVALTAATAHNE